MTQDPSSWFDGAARVLFVHAHPDDETISTGGTLAALAAAGREPLLVTLTRGERGEVVAGPFAQLAGTDGLAPHRQAELAAALALLAVERHAFLGVPPARAEGLSPTIYEDSGMAWGPDGRATAASDASADALTSVPAVEVLNDLLAAATQAGAGAIVSYDDGGGYGHPDHVLAHRAARAVAHALELPFWEIVSGADSDPDFQAHDIGPWYERKVAALRCHATQLTVIEGEIDHDRADSRMLEIEHGRADSRMLEIEHVGGQREPITRVERFRRR